MRSAERRPASPDAGPAPTPGASSAWRNLPERDRSSVGPAHDRLARRLGLGDAVAIGLAAMIGAGVFAVWAPAAQAAGAGLLIGLAIAAFVAFANAGSGSEPR